MSVSIEKKSHRDARPFVWDNNYLHLILTTGQKPIVSNKYLSNAFLKISRIDFVPQDMHDSAFMDYDIDVGYGCVLHKPTIIAQILELLNPTPGKDINVLDIGTGSGYVASLLATACGPNAQVYSLERVQFLTDIARINLNKYKDLQNVKVILRDGSLGLHEKAPFDFIHISASYEDVPSELLNQLKIGGRLVIPTTDKYIHMFERLSEKEFQDTIYKLFNFDKIKSGIE